jgi:predicted phage terminase large subunit-like protein
MTWTRWLASPDAYTAIRAELARRRLINFCTFTFPQYQPGRVHRFMAEQLEAVERGDIRRLMLFLPPRTGKTELLIRWIAWCLGRHPDWPMLYTSYGADLAWDKSSEARGVVASEEYQQVFGRLAPVPFDSAQGPVMLDPASRSVERWRLDGHRGGLQAQGVGGPLTGKGGMVIVVDDPVKNRAEADSPTFRRRTWDWYTSTLRTRLEPGGRIVVCLTRWHEDDLAGRLLRRAQEDSQADQWTMVSLPALAKEHDPLGRAPGEALDPGRYDEAALAAIRASIGTRDWAALFDQEPRPDEGNVFKRPWLRYVERAPATVYECVVWDTAFEESQASDYSAAVWVARGADGQVYVRPLANDRLAFPELVQVAREIARRWSQAEQLVEGKASGKSLRQQLRTEGIPLIEFPAHGDKVARAHTVTRFFEAGMVHLAGAPGDALVEALESELLAFPQATHDDLVDATVYGVMRCAGLLELAPVEAGVVYDERVSISPW